jgi:CHASE3 domain sensor protein
LTNDNPEQQRNVSVLEGLMAERLKWSEANIGLRRNQGLESAANGMEMDRT